MRFNFFDLIGREPAYVEAVLESALEEFFEERQFFLFGGHNHFTADIVIDPMLLAKLDHGAAAFARKFGLEAARLVVNAGMNNTAVSTGLMQRKVLLLFQQQDREPGLTPAQNHRGSEADNAAADDCAVKS